MVFQLSTLDPPMTPREDTVVNRQYTELSSVKPSQTNRALEIFALSDAVIYQSLPLPTQQTQQHGRTVPGRLVKSRRYVGETESEETKKKGEKDGKRKVGDFRKASYESTSPSLVFLWSYSLLIIQTRRDPRLHCVLSLTLLRL